MGQTKCPYKCKTFNNEWIKDICPAGHLESQWWWCWGTSSVLMADLESYFSKAAVSGNLNITLSRNRLADTIILPQFSSPPTYFFSKTFLFGFWCGSFFRQKKRCTKNALENQNSELRSGFQLMWVVTWLPERLFVFCTAATLLFPFYVRIKTLWSAIGKYCGV